MTVPAAHVHSDDLAAVTGRPATAVHIVGGGSRNQLLNQVYDDVLTENAQKFDATTDDFRRAVEQFRLVKVDGKTIEISDGGPVRLVFPASSEVGKDGEPVKADDPDRLREWLQKAMYFSPGTLKAPAGVKLKSVDLTVSLESLSFYLAQEQGNG